MKILLRGTDSKEGAKEAIESPPSSAQPQNAAELLLAVQRKIEQGDYDCPEVRSQVAEAILDAMDEWYQGEHGTLSLRQRCYPCRLLQPRLWREFGNAKL